MNSKKTFMTAVFVAVLPIVAQTLCSSGNDEPNGGSVGEALDNEVVLAHPINLGEDSLILQKNYTFVL